MLPVQGGRRPSRSCRDALGDRAYDSGEFLAAVDRTGAKLLVRGGSSRKPPVLDHLPDGSYLSDVAGPAVRIIEADLAMRGTDGTAVHDSCRLITTLLDERRYPAAVLIRLYHERWEIESAFLALRHTLLGGHVLRSGDRAGVEQDDTPSTATSWTCTPTGQLRGIASRSCRVRRERSERP